MTDRELDETISSWLEGEAPRQMPDRVLRVTFERTSRSRQHGGWRALPGRPQVPRFIAALGGAAVLVLVAALALNFYANRQGVGGPPTPSPSATTPPIGFSSDDGEVTVSAPSTWRAWLPGKAPSGRPEGEASDVWFGMLSRASDPWPRHSSDHIGFVDPVAYDSWCATHGGSPLLSAPADAAAIAQQVIADPNFETTAPVAAHVGGLDAVSIDVALAPGGRPCGIQMIEISRWVHTLIPGYRLRLYLVDLPDGMSVETLAIHVLAPEDLFEEVLTETAPIIESIEFHPASSSDVP